MRLIAQTGECEAIRPRNTRAQAPVQDLIRGNHENPPHGDQAGSQRRPRFDSPAPREKGKPMTNDVWYMERPSHSQPSSDVAAYAARRMHAEPVLALRTNSARNRRCCPV
jgi:hypothetical protein